MAEAAETGRMPCYTRASWIVNAPVPLFAVTMGHAGLGLAWRSACSAFGVPHVIAEIPMALAAVAFVLVALLYLLKLVACPRAVAEDFAHPVLMNFFPAISMSLMLLAAGALPYDPGWALGLWSVGAAAHLVFSVAIIGGWIRRNTEIAHASPAWFIPVAGNVVVPIAGVPLGFETVSWFFFAAGLTFWMPLFTIVLYRLIFHDPLPPRIAPLMFILMAPPAAGFLGYMQLNGGQLDVLAHILASAAIFIALVLASLAGQFARLPFALSWWAFTFPSAALAGTLLTYQELVPGPVPELAALAALAFATAIIALVTLRTLGTLVTGKLFAG
jgi:tellurite resistance protein